MGRRMKSTKSGKYINPTDQARKVARKKELRKNRKQRLLVRTAVLKGKDPFQIITDLERLDKMEYDFNNPPSLNEKVLKDKRRKLKETWERICRLYNKEDKERFLELKRIEAEYEMKRNELIKQFEAVKSAQEVCLEDIPLPSLPIETANSSIELPTNSILKPSQKNKQPPGCPPDLPPTLSEFECEDDDEEGNESLDEINTKKIRFSDVVETASNLQEFLKEIEQISTKKDNEEDTISDKDNQTNNEDKTSSDISMPALAAPLAATNVLISNPTVQSTPPIMIAPSLPVPQLPMNIRPNPSFVPPRLPLPPPRLPIAPQLRSQTMIVPTNSFLNYSRKNDEKKPQVTTIEAKPQLRNLSADSTKFMPLALRVKRDEKQTVKKPTQPIVGYGMIKNSNYSSATKSANPKHKDQTNSKDDAYDQFMKEMQGFI